jgi:hypothetical protein
MYCHLFLGCYKRGRIWLMDLLTTYTHQTERQVITAPSLNSTLFKSLQHPLSIFPTCCVIINRSLTTAFNIGDSSASRAHGLSTASRAELN